MIVEVIGTQNNPHTTRKTNIVVADYDHGLSINMYSVKKAGAEITNEISINLTVPTNVIVIPNITIESLAIAATNEVIEEAIDTIKTLVTELNEEKEGPIAEPFDAAIAEPDEAPIKEPAEPVICEAINGEDTLRP